MRLRMDARNQALAGVRSTAVRNVRLWWKADIQHAQANSYDDTAGTSCAAFGFSVCGDDALVCVRNVLH
jgi:hypothetical protein